jgi:hypothetical protein
MDPANYILMSPNQRRLMRIEYVFEQDNLCCHCKESLNKEPQRKKPINWSLFPPNFLAHPVHLHHDHKTGMTIGAVHAYCNAELWQYRGE